MSGGDKRVCHASGDTCHGCPHYHGKAILCDHWTPTAENINALPDPIRLYIAALETNADPAGMVAENTLVKDLCRQLDAKIANLKEQLY